MFEKYPASEILTSFLVIFLVGSLLVLSTVLLEDFRDNLAEKDENSSEHRAVVTGKRTDTETDLWVIPPIIPMTNSTEIYFIKLRIPAVNKEVELKVGKELYHYVEKGDERQVAVNENGRVWLIENKTTDAALKTEEIQE